MRTPQFQPSGLSLIEIITALCLVQVLAASAYLAQSHHFQTVATHRQALIAQKLASGHLETLSAKPWKGSFGDRSGIDLRRSLDFGSAGAESESLPGLKATERVTRRSNRLAEVAVEVSWTGPQGKSLRVDLKTWILLAEDQP